MHRRTLILSLLAFVGCHSKKKIRGDFGQFLLSEIHGRGGRTLQVDALPVIEGQWEVKRDEFGFQIHLFGVEFEAVDSFMTAVLGQPKIAVPKNVNGNPQRMYDKDVSGMHIQLIGEKAEIYVVAVGPKK
jgi:hypothetical protein